MAKKKRPSPSAVIWGFTNAHFEHMKNGGRLVAQFEGREYLFLFKPGQISKRPVFPTIVAEAKGARAR